MHSVPIGYLYWIFGFMGTHRFYYGKPVSGTVYFFTFGLLGIGWIVDAFFISKMDKEANLKFHDGSKNYTIAWLLLTFLGIFGAHRFYMGKWITGLLWFFTGGLFTVGLLYDYWTLNDQLFISNGALDTRNTYARAR